MIKRKRGKDTTYDEKLVLEAIEFLNEKRGENLSKDPENKERNIYEVRKGERKYGIPVIPDIFDIKQRVLKHIPIDSKKLLKYSDLEEWVRTRFGEDVRLSLSSWVDEWLKKGIVAEPRAGKIVRISEKYQEKEERNDPQTHTRVGIV